MLETRRKKNGQKGKRQCRSSLLMERTESELLLIYQHTHTQADTSTSARWENLWGDERCCACCCHCEGDVTLRVTGTLVLILHHDCNAELRRRITESPKLSHQPPNTLYYVETLRFTYKAARARQKEVPITYSSIYCTEKSDSITTITMSFKSHTLFDLIAIKINT